MSLHSICCREKPLYPYDFVVVDIYADPEEGLEIEISLENSHDVFNQYMGVTGVRRK